MTRIVLFAAAAAVVSAGCGGGTKAPSFANVSGSVTVDGHPLDKGIISFSCEGNPPRTMDIVDGKYTGQAMVGSNTVSISARRKVEKADPRPGARERMEGEKRMKEQRAAAGGGGGGGGQTDYSSEGTEEMIPKDYNTNSKQNRVVEAGGENKFDFLIKTK